MSSKKLPLIETAQVLSKKLPLIEDVWLLIGFFLKENIIEWKTKNITLMENIQSRIIVDYELVDKNHIKIKWYGDPVPKVLIYTKLASDDWTTTPVATLDWSVGEYVLAIGNVACNFRVIGINNSGESDDMNVGETQEYGVNMKIALPLNEKYYYFEYNLLSEYRFEVNL